MNESRYWRRYQRFSEWEDGVVRLAIEAGYVTAQIARMIGRSPDSVSRHCKVRGIPRGRARRLAKATIAALILMASTDTARAGPACEYGYATDPEANATDQRLCEMEFKLEEVASYTRNVDAYLRAICSHYPEDCQRAKEGKMP